MIAHNHLQLIDPLLLYESLPNLESLVNAEVIVHSLDENQFKNADPVDPYRLCFL